MVLSTPRIGEKSVSSNLPRSVASGQGPLAMVIGNGLVLTIASYLLINMFISQTERNGRQLLQQEIAQMTNDRAQKVAADFDMMAMLVSLSESEINVGEALQARSREGDRLPFSIVMWLPDGHFQEYGSAILYPSVPDAKILITPVLHEIRESAIKRGFTSTSTLQGLPLFVSVEMKESRITAQKRIFQQSQRKIALLKYVTREKAGPGVLMALIDTDQLIGTDFLVHRDHINRILLRDNQTDEPLIDIRPDVFGVKQTGPQGFVADALSRSYLNGWAFFISVEFQTSTSQESRLLQVLPWLIIGFGTILTLLGALYVRNNQHQSTKLAGMNRTLALKNMELNSQVTERERLNQTLRKTERENRAIIDSVSDIIFEVDMTGKFVFLNESWKRITGLEFVSGKDMNLFDVISPRDRDDQKREFEYLTKGVKPAYRFITRLHTADDQYRTVEIAFSMLRMDGSKNMRVVGTITDVEERRRAEFALSEAERQYRSIWENVASGIYQVTPEGQLLTANPALAHIFGYDSPSEMLSDVQNMHRQLYAVTKDRQMMIRDLMMTGHVQSVETQGVRKDKSRFWLAETARVVKDDDDNILYFEGSIDDITKRKEAEGQLRDAMLKSDLANRSKTEFLANMSHELRTPLNAIIGFSEIIRDEVFGKLQQRQYWEYAKDIHESGKHLLSIINTILDVAKIETGERHLNETVVDMRELSVDVIELVSPRAEANEQILNLVIPDEFPRLVCEELAVKQIFANLLSNAIKYTPTGGRITMSAEIESSGEMKIAVTDTGVGLDEDELNRVMAPFGHASSHFTRDSSGSGLGLTLVHSLARVHGGRLELFSQKGVGTTAAVIFPASRVHKTSA